MKVTLKDIAEQAGVSTATVSRVLKGSSLISSEQSTKIFTIAQQLGYERSGNKRHRGRAVLTLKLVLGYLNDANLPSFYSVPQLLQSIREHSGTNHVNLICETSSEHEQLFRHKKGGNIDGIIFAFITPSAKTLQKLQEQELPYICINRAQLGGDHICYNNKDGMQQLVQLAHDKQQHKKACFLSFDSNEEVLQERLSGFISACEQLGIEYKTLHFNKLEDVKADDLKQLQSDDFTYLAAHNDLLAVRIYCIGQSIGLRFPVDFALSGFDGSGFDSLLPQRIATIDRLPQELGRHIGNWLEERILLRQQEPWKICIEGKLIEGESL